MKIEERRPMDLLQKKSVRVSMFIIFTVMGAFLFYSLLHGRHTGVFLPWHGGFIVLPLRHLVVYIFAMMVSMCILYFLLFKLEAVKQLPENISVKIKSPDFTENLFIVSLLTILIALFIYILRNVALATHDDIQTYVATTTNSWSEFMYLLVPNLANRGRIALTSFFTQTVMWVVYNLHSMVIYTLVFYIPIVVNTALFAYIVSKRTSKYMGYLIVALFFAYAQINFQHNLFVAFPFGFQFRLFMFLLSAEFFLQHFENEKKHRLLISALLMFSTFFGYESFLTYFALFPAYLLCKSFSASSLKSMVNDFLRSLLMLKYHFAAVIIFVINYFVTPRALDAVILYHGTMVAVERMSVQSVLTVLWSFSTDLFPVSNFVRYGFAENFTVSQIGTEMVIMAFCATIVCCFALTKNIEITGKKVISICFISLVAAFVFPLPQSLTILSHSFVLDHGATGFVPSFFSFFWFILILAVLLVYIYKLLKFNKLLLLVIAPIIFMTTIFTGVANASFISHHEANLTRYKAFRNIFSSEYISDVEDGVFIYVHGFTGIHGVLHINAEYVYQLSGRRVTFTRNFESIADKENRFFLRYCRFNNFIMLGKINPDATGLYGDELFIMPMESIINGGFVGIKTPAASPVAIDGVVISQHNHSINIPLSYIGMGGVLVQADGLLFERVAIIDAIIPSNQLPAVENSP